MTAASHAARASVALVAPVAAPTQRFDLVPMRRCARATPGGLSLQLTFQPSEHVVVNNMEALSLGVLVVSFLIGSLRLCVGYGPEPLIAVALSNVSVRRFPTCVPVLSLRKGFA